MCTRFLYYHVLITILANALPLSPIAAAEGHQPLKKGGSVDTNKWNPKHAFNQQSNALQSLMLALYECKPQELQKNTQVIKEEYVQWVFEGPFDWKFDAIRKLQSIEALQLSFSPDYHGDRILPLVTGLHTMLLQAYGGQTEYIFRETTNPQHLYIASKNTETSASKLLNTLDENGQPYLNAECQKIIQKTLAGMANTIQHDAKLNSTTGKNEAKLNMQRSTPEQADKLDFIQF